VTASNSNSDDATPIAVAVIRSRGTYKPYSTGSTDDCVCEDTKYDTLKYYVGEVPHASDGTCVKDGYKMNALQIQPYVPMNSNGNECAGYGMSAGEINWGISQYNHGRFKLVGVVGVYTDTGDTGTDIIIKKGSNKYWDYEAKEYKDYKTDPAEIKSNRAEAIKMGYFEYPVTLNPGDKEYILNVLGTKPYDGEAPIFVESLYDVALDQAIAEGLVTQIDHGNTVDTGEGGLQFYQAYYTADFCHHEPVGGLLTMSETSLRRKHVGMRFLGDSNIDGRNPIAENKIHAVPYDYKENKPYTVATAQGVEGITLKM
jgi:hypothetical protein